MRVRSLVAPTALLALLAVAPAAYAQKDAKAAKAEEKSEAKTEAKDDKAEAKDGAKEGDKAEAKDGDDKDAAKPAKPEEEKLAPNDAKELPGKTYYFVGARWRQTLLPKFMLNLFVAGGPKQVWIPSFGIEGTMRRDGFDTTLYLTYADWGMDAFAFKGKDEANTAWEIVDSKLKLINLGVDLLWGTDLDKGQHFQFQYGITTGIAIVLGDLKRVQGKPKAGGDPGNPDDIEACPGVIPNPQPGYQYCTSDNNHYGDYTENSWFNGGKKPNIYASFGPQIGVRFKPGKPFMARLNIGWDIFQGPFLGLNGSYGL